MAITMTDVRAWLDPEEPNYAGAARSLGSAALPYLLELVRGGDLGLASKAVSLASLITSDKSVDVLEAAIDTNDPVLRVAAAAGLQRLKPAHAERLLDALERDDDPGVRKVMVRSAARVNSPRARAIVQRMAQSDPEPFVREMATRTAATAKAPVATPRGGAKKAKKSRKVKATKSAKRSATTRRTPKAAAKRATRKIVKAKRR
jgi:hypothetical protein